jgi:hypothetical protein
MSNFDARNGSKIIILIYILNSNTYKTNTQKWAKQYLPKSRHYPATIQPLSSPIPPYPREYFIDDPTEIAISRPKKKEEFPPWKSKKPNRWGRPFGSEEERVLFSSIYKSNFDARNRNRIIIRIYI